MAMSRESRQMSRAVMILMMFAVVCNPMSLMSPSEAWIGPRRSAASNLGAKQAAPLTMGAGQRDSIEAQDHQVHNAESDGGWWFTCLTAVTALSLLFCVNFAAPGPASATDKRLVGEIPASGLIFKDTINVEEFDDPKVSGVSLYLSDFSRSITDRVAKGDFFSDPGAAGLTCAANGPVKIAPDLSANKQGEDVLTEARSLLFKTLKVKRVYDPTAKNIVYVVFTERVDTSDDKNKSRFKSQLCAVHVDWVQEAVKK